jgi:guanylate kinase
LKPDSDTPQFPNYVPLVLIVSGPSGAGKTSLVNSLLTNSDRFIRAITSTCRAPRPGEINGVDYHFLTPEEFQRRLKADEFLEHARVFGNDYGMPKQNIALAFEQRKDLAINIDVQGAATIRSHAKKLKLKALGCDTDSDATLADILLSVFLMPASVQQLEERLKKRKTDDEATIQHRLSVALHEMQRWKEYDFVIVSGPLSEDLRQLQGIITAERLCAKRLAAFM